MATFIDEITPGYISMKRWYRWSEGEPDFQEGEYYALALEPFVKNKEQATKENKLTIVLVEVDENNEPVVLSLNPAYDLTLLTKGGGILYWCQIPRTGLFIMVV